MLPTYWQQATAELSERDKVLKELIARHQDMVLKSRGEPFYTLARSIVGQQISVKASDKVWQRLIEAVPELTPKGISGSIEEDLRACGLSQRKVSYLRDLARHFEQELLEPAGWEAMDDEAVIADLMRVRGIGRWTAEMFLIFNLQRPDVLPLDDFGLQRAMSMHYNNDQPLSKLKIRVISNQWQPWRSVATWYLWRSLDPTPVEY